MSPHPSLVINVSQIRPDLDARFTGPACVVHLSIDLLDANPLDLTDIEPPPMLVILDSILHRLLERMMNEGSILRVDFQQPGQLWQNVQICRDSQELRGSLAMIADRIGKVDRGSIPLIYVWAIPSALEYETSMLINEVMETPDAAALWEAVIEQQVVVCRLDADSCSVSADCERIEDVAGWVDEALGRSPWPVAREQ